MNMVDVYDGMYKIVEWRVMWVSEVHSLQV